MWRRRRQRRELGRHRAPYQGDRPRISPKGRNVIIIDDGIATAARPRRQSRRCAREARAIMLAVPAAPPSAIASLRRQADRIVCLATPNPFRAVSLHYDDVEQTTDAEVIALMKRARGGEEGSDSVRHSGDNE
jgi:putative phosphoribosyl transferase